MSRSDRDFVNAEYHLLAAQTRDSARLLAALLYDWYKSSPDSNSSTSTLGRYAARGVLSYLEGSSILCAHAFLDRFLTLALQGNSSLAGEKVALSTWPEKSSPEFTATKLASLNFLQLLIRSCQMGTGEQVQVVQGRRSTVYPGRQAFLQLIQRYEREVPWLAKEQDVKASTAEIGEMYFGIQQRRAGGANVLGDLMGSLFGGGGGAGGASNAPQRRQIAGKGTAPKNAPPPSVSSAELD